MPPVFVLAEDCFSYLGSLEVPYDFQDFLYVKYAIGILIGIAVNLYIGLVRGNILTISLLMHEHECLSIEL